ncbi:MAG: helix-hairpin-helix domain-containing protein [Candidatus Wallbacteria bacterium]|nr:helix-hairpin-helix domain-containing protein [Candidatus Wallbacteria bacterium]
MRIALTLFILLSFQVLEARIDDRIDLNLAQQEQLMTLYGISEQDADNIMKYRLDKGEFKRIEEVIPIIGDDKFELIKYDLKVTPLETRFRDALSGYVFMEQYNLVDGLASAQDFGKMKVNVYDAVEVNLSKKKTFKNNNELFNKDKWEYFRSVTLNHYKRVDITKAHEIKNEPDLELFKTVDLKKEREEKAGDAITFLDDYFNGKPKIQKKKQEVVGGQYLLSDYDENKYFTTEDSKRALYETNKANIRYVRRDQDGPTLPPKELPAEQEEKMKDIDGPHFRKELKDKLLIGNFYLPPVRSPLVAKSSSEHISGLRLYHFENNWDNSLFLADMPLRDGSVFGGEFNFNVGKDSKFSMVGYNMHEHRFGNNFPCLSLNGSKQLTNDTSAFIEFDSVANKAYSTYGKIFTTMGNYSLTCSLNSVTPTYRIISLLQPYFEAGGGNYTFQGLLEGYFKMSYKFLESSTFSLDFTNTKKKGNYFTENVRDLHDYSIYLDYEPAAKWSFNVTNSYKDNNYDETKYKNNMAFSTQYQADETTTWKLNFKNTAFKDSNAAYHKLECVKKYHKLSIGPAFNVYRNDPDDGSGDEAVCELNYEFNKNTYLATNYDVGYSKNKAGHFDDERTWHVSFNSKF